jgi:peptidoglycan-associated lipoprotein
MIYLVAGGMLLLLAGCNKKAARVVPPAPPSPATPTATLAANPSVIERGQSTQLVWQTTNANSITIEGIGDLPASGSRTITPDSSSTYTLIATGAGGAQQATTQVTVNPNSGANAVSPSNKDVFAKNVKDVFFDFNNSTLRSDQNSAAFSDANFLAEHSRLNVTIEGHCDDRGSEEYNLALGDSRANSLKATLIAQGVSADRIKTVSYGKERPFCSRDDDQCWQQNRRDHVSLQQ